MTASGTARRRAWGSLSRDEILRVARRVIEESGLQELSLTRLGKEMRAGATSLYWYFESKEELVAAVVADVTSEMNLLIPPVGDGPWDEEFLAHFLAGRRMLQRARVYREVFVHQAQSTFLHEDLAPFLLDRLEALVAHLVVGAGLTPDEAVQTYNAFQDYTRAFVLVEEGMQRDQIEPNTLQLLALAVGMVTPEFPGDTAADQLAQGLRLDDDCYRRGLDLLVAGVRRGYLTDSKAATPRVRKRPTRTRAHGS